MVFHGFCPLQAAVKQIRHGHFGAPPAGLLHGAEADGSGPQHHHPVPLPDTGPEIGLHADAVRLGQPQKGNVGVEGTEHIHILLRHHRVLGKAAVAMHTHGGQMQADVGLSPQAGMAPAAARHRIHRDFVSHSGTGHSRTHRFHHAAKFMADDHRITGERMHTGCDLQIRAANTGRDDPNQHLVVMPDLRFGQFHNFQPMHLIHINCFHIIHPHK